MNLNSSKTRSKLNKASFPFRLYEKSRENPFSNTPLVCCSIASRFIKNIRAIVNQPRFKRKFDNLYRWIKRIKFSLRYKYIRGVFVVVKVCSGKTANSFRSTEKKRAGSWRNSLAYLWNKGRVVGVASVAYWSSKLGERLISRFKTRY